MCGRRGHGFTLIELLLCMAFFAMALPVGAHEQNKRHHSVTINASPDLLGIHTEIPCKRTSYFLLSRAGTILPQTQAIAENPVINCQPGSRVVSGAKSTTAITTERNERSRREMTRRVIQAAKGRKALSSLQGSKRMVRGPTFYLQSLPQEVKTKAILWIGGVEAGSIVIR